MSEIKILHLFGDLLSLYGEYGNPAILEKTLTDNGHTVTVDKVDSVPGDLSVYDLVCIGSGTEENIIEAAKRLLPFKEKIAESVGNTEWLVTGTAPALLGKTVSYRDREYECTAVFDFTTEMDHEKRWHSDVVTTADNLFGVPVIGYINTSSTYHGMTDTAFTLALGTDAGNDKSTPADGMMSGRLLATQITGPLLVKNPAVLSKYCERLTGETPEIGEYLTAAYDNALAQLSKRINSHVFGT